MSQIETSNEEIIADLQADNTKQADEISRLEDRVSELEDKVKELELDLAASRSNADDMTSAIEEAKAILDKAS